MPKPKRFADFLKQTDSFEDVVFRYRQKNEEARKLRAAINAFIKAISRIPTPSEKARRRKKTK